MNPEPVKTLTIQAVNELLIGYFSRLFGWEGQGRVLIETMARTRPPDGLYMTLWWKNNDLLVQNTGEFIQPEDESEQGTQQLDNESLCTVQVTLRGQDAYSQCCEARYSLESSQRFFDLWKLLGFSGCDPVTDMSGAFGAHVQQRAFFDFHFYACFGRGYPADWFDHSQWAINNTNLTI